jgi:hypothetical protein
MSPSTVSILSPALAEAFDRMMRLLAADARCLGAWHFGSLARGLADRFSDVDPVVLVSADGYASLVRELPQLYGRAADRLQVIWPERYNNDFFGNYGALLEHRGELFQFDLFLMRADRVDEHFCRVHRLGCVPDHVIFDKSGDVAALLARGPGLAPAAPPNLGYLIDTYFFHAQMIIKYLLRPDPLKMGKVLRELYHAHSEVLLAGYRRADWGSPETRLALDVPAERVAPLCDYLAPADAAAAARQLERAFANFGDDARAVYVARGIEFPAELERAVRTSFAKRCAALLRDAATDFSVDAAGMQHSAEPRLP